ncbi:MAG: asparagine synthase (glutamine-hydrolyzing) [Anaerolineae bacterium]|nr:asparagine synthase (glutamine-hydrolyzing) [Anaerolineae bacterium]MCI0608132.1 asparagine synthase (glutamine-hydrolyzing) [Anaerolineae bacterium]
MCGICGIVYLDPERNVDGNLINRMNDSIKHRGPDDSGVYINNNVGLGFRRLAIIDLSPAGHQPMTNEDGSVWIIFNGEIYNHLELREELLKKGHTYRSRTDSETIIHLWEEEGERCVERLRGMFAFAIWDSNQQTLLLARDREGKKPLFFAELQDRLLFGSEIKAILQDPTLQACPDLEAIHLYLAYQSVPAPYSAFKGIKKLPPAHTLLYKNGQVTLRRYWKLSYKEKRIIKTPQDQIDLQEEIIERLREAVRLRLMSDVPLGAFLSGGIDSSIIVALMAGLMDQPVKTFSIGFTYEEYNELPYARQVAEQYKTEHHEFIVTPDAQAIIPDLIWHYNEPFADSSAIPTYYVSKLAREYVTVVLTGDGGDENFAGYPRYQNQGEHALNKNYPSLLYRLLRPKGLMQTLSRHGGGWAKNFNRLKDLDQQKLLYYYRITHFHEGYQSQLYSQEFWERLNGLTTVDWMLDIYRQSDAGNYLDATLDLDLRLYLPDTLMTKTDIASMAHSLEARAPMLDHKFLEFVASIPPELKLKNGVESKYIFKKAVEPYLPHDIIYRKKMGFGVPIDHWFRHELREMVRDILLSQRAIERGYFRRDYIEGILDRHQNESESWQYLIWNLLMLELWHLMFIDKALPVPSEHERVF